MEPLHVTVVSHTHWDRAWYVGFQEYRARLVRLVDRLIALLDERPDYRVFMLDGQMAVLEDYLEVRPTRAERLKELCRSDRLKVGPWYVLADEFLVSPEALIRNMALGMRMGAEYGGAAKIGYVPDGFGHIAQLPQILRGFGIDNSFFWRGIGAEADQLGTEFFWRAPDGSKVLNIWMPWGYHNISNLGYPIHWGDTSEMEFDEALALDQIEKAVAALGPFSRSSARLLMNGIDHEEAEPRIPEVLAAARRAFPHLDIRQGTPEDHLRHVLQSNPDLPTFEGEFRWGRYSEILQAVYATRLYLKQRNHAIETLLERYAEPLVALDWLSGPAGQPEGVPDLLETAWKWLLRNHPHDDIYGSGIDLVHDEMLYRFNQAEQLGEILVRDSLRRLSRRVDFSAQPGTPLLAFNPLGWARSETVEAEIDFDFDDPTAGSFRLLDADGQAVPHQVLEDAPAFWMETLKANRKRRVRVAFQADVPACGYAAYFAVPAEAAVSPALPDWEIRADGASNRWLSFRIAPDGTLNVTDRVTGRQYPGLGAFVDVDDIGDEYSFCPAAQPSILTTRGVPAQVTLHAAGSEAAVYRIETGLDLPEGLSEDRSRRAGRSQHMSIILEVTLYRSRPGLFLKASFTNTTRDHLLKTVFPTGLNSDEAWVDESFAVLPRSLDLPESTGWVEDPSPLMHQRAFTDLSENGVGLAILNRGLPAVEVTRTSQGAQVDLILLRAVGWLSRDDLFTRRVAAGPLVPTPGAQCPGTFTCEYAILPHAGGWEAAFPTAREYTAPLKVSRADTHEGLELREMNITRDDPALVRPIPWPRGGTWPARKSFFEIGDPRLCLSALTRSPDGKALVLRLYNTSRATVETRLTAGFPVRRVCKVNLAGDLLEDLPISAEGSLALAARGAEVVTLWCFPEGEER